MADLERDRGADGAGDARGGLGLSGRRWYLGGGAIATMVGVSVLQPRSRIVNSSSGQLTRHPAFHHSPVTTRSRKHAEANKNLCTRSGSRTLASA